jgi:hypothetical protein
MMENCEIFIGWDTFEQQAYKVAEGSIRRRAFRCPEIHRLDFRELVDKGLFYRKMGFTDKGVLWDEISQAPCSTEFAISRFLTPIISTKPWSLFVDCDIVCLADIWELFQYADNRYAVQVVKHKMPMKANQRFKMRGIEQTEYSRKNWSSVMMFNNFHPSNRRRLTVDLINSIPGKHLHNFCWLADNEIGSLPPEWNYLVDVSHPMSDPKIMHYTLGGPWLGKWEPRESDKVWLDELKAIQNFMAGEYDLQGEFPF